MHKCKIGCGTGHASVKLERNWVRKLQILGVLPALFLSVWQLVVYVCIVQPKGVAILSKNVGRR